MASHSARKTPRARHSKLPGFLGTLTQKQLVVVGLATLALIGLIVGIVVATGSSSPTAGAGPVSTAPLLAKDRCPLTDLPSQSVPQRPAVAVKIGNEPGSARPQSGLNETDVVYDTPAEGFIMRYVAVFQCNDAASIGPVRSVRWVDWHILRAYINPILAFAGGINPDVDAVMNLGWAYPANLLEGGQAAGHRISSRSAPDNLYTSTDALYKLYPNRNKPPKPLFTYTSSLPNGAQSASSLKINFSAGTDVLWKWDASTNSWIHTYSGVTDVDAATGKPVSTTNIIVQVVHYAFGPYPESPGGSGDVESITQGTGQGWVLRNGKAIKVTWSRQNLVDPTTYTDANGQKVGLAPGRTWVEIVPNSTANAPGNLVVTK